MGSLINTLENSNLNDLLRAFNSSKEYLFFNISVFNSGVCINIKCTKHYKNINRNTWNGYDFIIENDFTTNEHIKNALRTILNDYTVNKTDRQIKRIKNLIK